MSHPTQLDDSLPYNVSLRAHSWKLRQYIEGRGRILARVSFAAFAQVAENPAPSPSASQYNQMLSTNLSKTIEKISKPLPQILAAYPNGKYTVLRTMGSGLVDWSIHLDRLEKVPDIEPTVTRVMKEFQSTFPSSANMKITILTWQESNVMVHVTDFIPIPTNKPLNTRLSTMADAPKRSDPTEKKSSWVANRAPLQKDTFDETLMSENGDNGVEILEGLASNVVFMGKDGLFYTTPIDRVLPGSVLNLVDAVLGDKLVYRAATLEELRKGLFKGAFLTGTSRICCPIREIQMMEGGSAVEFDVGGFSGELDVIREKVLGEMKLRLTFLY
jgi:branched-subunit amino acid aminotransferase/4-amino-4-deoxychorismate lyase